MPSTTARDSITNRPFLHRFTGYLIERFALATIIPATILHFLLILRFFSGSLNFHQIFNPATLIGYTTFFSVFLLIRLLDELKDKPHDDQYYQERPVQRGLITLSEIRSTIAVVIIMLASVHLIAPLNAQLTFISLLAFLWLMRHEFFLESILTKNIILYAVIHQLFIPILLQYLSYQLGYNAPVSHFIGFVVLNWLMIFAIEVSRKMRATSDDQTGRDTYSATVGRFGALVFLLSLLIGIAYLSSMLFHLVWLPWLSIVPVMMVGAYYYLTDTRLGSKLVLATTTLSLTIIMLGALR
jgi:large-conductance mechanosensitive channel